MFKRSSIFMIHQASKVDVTQAERDTLEEKSEHDCKSEVDTVNRQAFQLPSILKTLALNVSSSSTNDGVSEEKNMQTPCCICLEVMDVEEGQLYTISDCSHTFHKACITRWNMERDTCPICRGSIPNELCRSLSGMNNQPEEELLQELSTKAIVFNIILTPVASLWPLFLIVLSIVW